MDEKQKNNEKNSKKQYILLAVLVFLIIILAVAIYSLYANGESAEEKVIAYTELITQLNEGNVESIEMTVGSSSIKVKLQNEEEEKNVIVPSTQAFMELINQKVEDGIEFELNQKPTNVF